MGPSTNRAKRTGKVSRYWTARCYAGLLLLTIAAVGISHRSAYAQGYSLRDNRFVIETKEDWMGWKYPKGTIDISDDGVRPVLIQERIDAVENAKEFVYPIGADCLDEFPFHRTVEGTANLYEVAGGIRNAGCNLRDAKNITDGDPGTYWEPYIDFFPVKDWWIEVDLGRAVNAMAIVVRFAEEGDPFSRLKVSTALEYDPASKRFDWWLVDYGRVTDPGQRVFVFDTKWNVELGGIQRGRNVQYVQVMAVDSKGEKAEEVSRQRYEGLSPEDRGVIDHYRITQGGKEVLIAAEEYEKLEESEKGPLRYYRRERPRLAEVEVWSVGHNVARGALARGGSVDDPFMIDGSIRTYYRMMEVPGKRNEILLDLGAVFWIHRVLLISGVGGLGGYRIGGSDGTLSAVGQVIWKPLGPGGQAEPGSGYKTEVEVQFSPRKLRLLNIQLIGDPGYQYKAYTVRRTTIGEIETYAQGYVPEVTLTSPPIEIGTGKSLRTIHWDADIPFGTEVDIRTRTGDRLREVVHYYDTGGQEVTLRQYVKLPFFLKGPTAREWVVGEGWSDWSAPYQQLGEFITSPSPRKYLQIQVKLLSDDPNVHASLHSLEVEFFSPLVQSAVGEIFPPRIEGVGVPQDLSLFLHPTFHPSNPGFDGILIVSPLDVEMKLLGIRVGKEKDFLEGATQDWDVSSLKEEGSVLEGDSLLVYLPRPLRSGGADLIEMQFQSVIFLNKTPFQAFLLHSSLGQRQIVDVGDATVLVHSETMDVSVPMDRRIVGDVEIAPGVFTPNGDGINDEVEIGFSVFKAYTSKEVEVWIYDMGARRVRSLSERREVAGGRYRIVWDGTDEEGSMVCPGIYVIQICFDADSKYAKEDTLTRSVCVVY